MPFLRCDPQNIGIKILASIRAVELLATNFIVLGVLNITEGILGCVILFCD